MTLFRGFISLGIILLIVIGLAALGGSAYWANNRVPSELNQAVGQTASTTTEVPELTQEEICKLFDGPNNEEKSVFIACPGRHEKQIGKGDVTFGAQLIRPDGGNYEAIILYGDGDKEGVAHWSPTRFSEEVDHLYTQPGAYDASLVLIPTDRVKDFVSGQITLEQAHPILIKKIRIEVSAAGAISID